MFLKCSSNVPQMFLQCSSNVPSMFLKCSFNVPWRRNMAEKWKMIKITYEEDLFPHRPEASGTNQPSSGRGGTTRGGG
eukprot:6541090-Pyramimonas_sp.AAC.1